MDKKSSLQSKNITPLGINLMLLAKKYVGIIVSKLSHLDIERHFYILVVIDASTKPITQKDLADLFSIDKAAVVGIVDYLSDAGYIERNVNPKDRRQHIITLTKKAEKALPDIYNVYREVNSLAFNGMKKSEIDTFYKALENICSNFSTVETDNFYLDFKKLKSLKNIQKQKPKQTKTK
ncbi:MAG: MarR family transcriptional regulator [Chitinophagaceae bacterium]|nr:MAG: MarR family transcriptional regulator [Chitinophagaceae bacterium]